MGVGNGWMFRYHYCSVITVTNSLYNRQMYNTPVTLIHINEFT